MSSTGYRVYSHKALYVHPKALNGHSKASNLRSKPSNESLKLLSPFFFNPKWYEKDIVKVINVSPSTSDN